MTRRTALALLGISASIKGIPKATGEVCLLAAHDLAGQESVRGYASASKGSLAKNVHIGDHSIETASLCIVPVGRQLSAPLCRRLVGACVRGATVLVEHPMPFASDKNEAAGQAELCEQHFGVSIGPEEHDGAMYVELQWPIRCLVRTFGSARSLAGGRNIAASSLRCSGVEKRFGSGRLICLSTAIGPHLLSGDAEARAWLRAILNSEFGARLT
jgi:hypothetical protein